MKNLWIKSLLELWAESSNEEITPYKKISNIDVSREYRTSKGNSIDILVSSDNYVIGIENKVFSDVCNPFADYTETIKEKADELQCTPIYILLSLRNENEKIEMINANDNINWKNVTYDCLFDKVLNNFGEYVEDADEKWTIYMKDFIKTGRKHIYLMTGGSNMIFDDKLIDFMKINSERSHKFLKDMYEIKREIIRRVDMLKSEIDNDELVIQKTLNEDSLKNGEKQIWAWHGEDSKHLTGSAVIDIKINNHNYVVEAKLDYEWRVYLWDRMYNKREDNENIFNKVKVIDEDISIDREGWIMLRRFDTNADYTKEVLNEIRRGVKIIAKLAAIQ